MASSAKIPKLDLPTSSTGYYPYEADDSDHPSESSHSEGKRPSTETPPSSPSDEPLVKNLEYIAVKHAAKFTIDDWYTDLFEAVNNDYVRFPGFIYRKSTNEVIQMPQRWPSHERKISESQVKYLCVMLGMFRQTAIEPENIAVRPLDYPGYQARNRDFRSHVVNTDYFHAGEPLDYSPLLVYCTNIEDPFYKLSIQRLQAFANRLLKQDKYVNLALKHLYVLVMVENREGLRFKKLLQDCTYLAHPILLENSNRSQVQKYVHASLIPAENYMTPIIVPEDIDGAIQYRNYSILFTYWRLNSKTLTQWGDLDYENINVQIPGTDILPTRKADLTNSLPGVCTPGSVVHQSNMMGYYNMADFRQFHHRKPSELPAVHSSVILTSPFGYLNESPARTWSDKLMTLPSDQPGLGYAPSSATNVNTAPTGTGRCTGREFRLVRCAYIPNFNSFAQMHLQTGLQKCPSRWFIQSASLARYLDQYTKLVFPSELLISQRFHVHLNKGPINIQHDVIMGQYNPQNDLIDLKETIFSQMGLASEYVMWPYTFIYCIKSGSDTVLHLKQRNPDHSLPYNMKNAERSMPMQTGFLYMMPTDTIYWLTGEEPRTLLTGVVLDVVDFNEVFDVDLTRIFQVESYRTAFVHHALGNFYRKYKYFSATLPHLYAINPATYNWESPVYGNNLYDQIHNSANLVPVIEESFGCHVVFDGLFIAANPQTKNACRTLSTGHVCKCNISTSNGMSFFYTKESFFFYGRSKRYASTDDVSDNLLMQYCCAIFLLQNKCRLQCRTAMQYKYPPTTLCEDSFIPGDGVNSNPKGGAKYVYSTANTFARSKMQIIMRQRSRVLANYMQDFKHHRLWPVETAKAVNAITFDDLKTSCFYKRNRWYETLYTRIIPKQGTLEFLRELRNSLMLHTENDKVPVIEMKYININDYVDVEQMWL